VDLNAKEVFIFVFTELNDVLNGTTGNLFSNGLKIEKKNIVHK